MAKRVVQGDQVAEVGEARRLLERAEALVSCELEVVPSARGVPGEKPPGIPHLIASDWLKEARAYLALAESRAREGELVAALERINRQASASITILFRDSSTAEARREKSRELHSGLKDIGDTARALAQGKKE